MLYWTPNSHNAFETVGNSIRKTHDVMSRRVDNQRCLGNVMDSHVKTNFEIHHIDTAIKIEKICL